MGSCPRSTPAGRFRTPRWHHQRVAGGTADGPLPSGCRGLRGWYCERRCGEPTDLDGVAAKPRKGSRDAPSSADGTSSAPDPGTRGPNRARALALCDALARGTAVLKIGRRRVRLVVHAAGCLPGDRPGGWRGAATPLGRRHVATFECGDGDDCRVRCGRSPAVWTARCPWVPSMSLRSAPAPVGIGLG
jgi:hypothetical protein